MISYPCRARALVVLLAGVALLSMPPIAQASTTDPSWRLFAGPRSVDPIQLYDGARRRMMLICSGDLTANGPIVWAADLDSTYGWAPLATSGDAPPFYDGNNVPLYGGVLAPSRDRIVVWGGDSIYPSGYGTWGLSLQTLVWTRLSTSGFDFHGEASIYDPVGDRALVLCGLAYSSLGGVDGQNTVYQFPLSGAADWSEVAVAGTPPTGRGFMAAIFDAKRDRVLIHYSLVMETAQPRATQTASHHSAFKRAAMAARVFTAAWTDVQEVTDARGRSQGVMPPSGLPQKRRSSRFTLQEIPCASELPPEGQRVSNLDYRREEPIRATEFRSKPRVHLCSALDCLEQVLAPEFNPARSNRDPRTRPDQPPGSFERLPLIGGFGARPFHQIREPTRQTDGARRVSRNRNEILGRNLRQPPHVGKKVEDHLRRAANYRLSHDLHVITSRVPWPPRAGQRLAVRRAGGPTRRRGRALKDKDSHTA